ncbi:MAG: EAL domain-containing protein [Enterobacterales bacterium]|nr:EAL domain-containing protein [Enterobacterales bacterium]
MLVTIGIAFVNNLIHQQSDITSKIFVLAMLDLLAIYWLVERGQSLLGSILFLWSLYLLVTLLLITNDGLRDPAAIGYTGILIFAAMLGDKKHFIILAVTMALSFIALGIVNDFGWVDYSATPFGWGIVIDLLIIYIVVSYSAWTLANDLRFALSSLEIENLRVKESRREYQKIAHFDQLTGLPNRIIAVDRFNQAIFHCQRNGSKVALLFLDLDNFKTVNDSLGHSVGDHLLQAIASRLEKSVREGDTVCRLGGDEFLIILDSITNEQDISCIAIQILTAISEPLIIDSNQLTTSCSIGVAIAPKNGDGFDELRKKADMAMYKAKNAGKNGFLFYDDDMNKDMLAHIDILNSLRDAIDNREFLLYYQPKIDLKTGKISSAEALIRWRTPDKRLIMPNDFIAIAESTGFIIEIGEWVLYEACRQCKEFQNQGLDEFSIAVNLSSVQFRRGNLEQIIVGALSSSGLDAKYLELEVTESLLVEDVEDVCQQIQRLQLMGIRFSIDDFGTGYSSMSYLKEFNFDYLKIDRVFIKNSLDNPNDMALCEAIIVMAHKLNLIVVAEGIETQLQKDFLVAAGCQYGQGNYFSKPLPVKKFYQLIE